MTQNKEIEDLLYFKEIINKYHIKLTFNEAETFTKSHQILEKENNNLEKEIKILTKSKKLFPS